MSISQISAWLWVGGAPSADDLVRLMAQGLTLDINCTPQLDPLPTAGLDGLLLGWNDDSQPKPLGDFALVIARIAGHLWAHAHKPDRVGVLIHCGAGVNRAPMLATCVLAYFDGTSAEDAWKRLVAARPEANAWNVPAYRQSIEAALAALRGAKAS